jgi:hypothetical protein
MSDADRVREATSDEINEQIDRETAMRVRAFEGRSAAEIGRRIEELDREWDIERALALNASVLALSGVSLAAIHSKRWLIVPGVVLPFLIQHAVQGWCPPIEIFRRLGIRTRKEIDKERYALKVLRGDFDQPARTRDAADALDAVGV